MIPVAPPLSRDQLFNAEIYARAEVDVHHRTLGVYHLQTLRSTAFLQHVVANIARNFTKEADNLRDQLVELKSQAELQHVSADNVPMTITHMDIASMNILRDGNTTTPFKILAQVEVCLIMQYLCIQGRIALARSCKSMMTDAGTLFAWKFAPPLLLFSEKLADGETPWQSKLLSHMSIYTAVTLTPNEIRHQLLTRDERNAIYTVSNLTELHTASLNRTIPHGDMLLLLQHPCCQSLQKIHLDRATLFECQQIQSYLRALPNLRCVQYPSQHFLSNGQAKTITVKFPNSIDQSQ